MLLLGRGCCWGRRACDLEGELTQLRLRAWEPWFQYSEFKLSEKCLFPWTWMLSLVSNHDEWLVCPLKASLCKSRCESNNLTFLPEFFLENVVLTKKYKIACKLFVQFTIMIVKHNNFEFFFEMMIGCLCKWYTACKWYDLMYEWHKTTLKFKNRSKKTHFILIEIRASPWQWQLAKTSPSDDSHLTTLTLQPFVSWSNDESKVRIVLRTTKRGRNSHKISKLGREIPDDVIDV